ncbi:MAG TPA: glycoside hydrolase family 36 protein [Terriglobales bacterium]|nr:glycoside hydrolase family 36 protein [Terriglobales bacterium]
MIARKSRIMVLCITLVLAILPTSCSKLQKSPPQNQAAKPQPTQPSAINVDIKGGGPLTLATKATEFEVTPDGYVQAFLLKDGQKLSLDDPNVGTPSDSNFVRVAGKDVNFTLDFQQAQVHEAMGKMGVGKRVEIPARPLGPSGTGLEAVIALEVYDKFPNILLSAVEYRNTGNTEIKIDKSVNQRHRLNARSIDAKARPYEMWSFHGASYDWGKDDVVKLTPAFSQPNIMGEMVKGGYGGGIPVVAFWTREVGEAVGHVETIPIPAAIPAKVAVDGRVDAEVDYAANITLKPGETYSTPRSFVSVYSGDFYEPLRIWSSVLQKEGWDLPKPSSEAYNVSWCGWGYQENVTPAQMLGTIPKLKEMGIKWVTLDDRWFDVYGDWNPRPDTFPGDSIKKMVDDFHKEGMLAQIWWLPLAVEDGQGRYESHKYEVSKIAKEHPEWLILDKNGKHARMTRGLAALCPAVPEVRAYHKQITEKFIRDWGFDGSKLDNIYSVPECYNPAHHHKSPQDSTNAMGDIYKEIFQTTRAIKPQSVTQSCPCGTPPSLAWLPFMDQAVTADPVGAIQVRRRIKMYKALLGPESAVYGDHVELSAMTKVGNDYTEHGDDFASTIGAGGVVGTKFVWPDPGPKFKDVNLTAAKEERWKKWIGLYNEKMLSKGEFRDLYVTGYDTPEAYAIAKDGKMYYAFFGSANWKGAVELRGLKPGKYSVSDYSENKDLRTVDAGTDGIAKLPTEFKDHLLLEVTPQP